MNLSSYLYVNSGRVRALSLSIPETAHRIDIYKILKVQYNNIKLKKLKLFQFYVVVDAIRFCAREQHSAFVVPLWLRFLCLHCFLSNVVHKFLERSHNATLCPRVGPLSL